MAMTPTCVRWRSTVLGAIFIVGFAASLLGCANLGPLTPAPVSDVRSVAGTWKGVVYGSGSEAQLIELTIAADGSYEVVVSLQPIGESRGKGKVVVRDGRLVFEGPRGRGLGTVLTNAAGDRVMNIEATLSDASIVSAKLSPSR
jgi:hypothetical protein